MNARAEGAFESSADESEVESFARRTLDRKAKENPGMYARDAWENQHLGLIPADPEELVSLLKKTDETLKHGMFGAMALYIKHVGGDKVYGQFMDVSSVKKQLIEGRNY